MMAMFETIKKAIANNNTTAPYRFVLCVIFTACHHIQTVKTNIPQQVPRTYVNTVIGGFSTHQDTLYFMRHLFTGYLYLLYATGDTEYVTPYYNGLQEGMQQKWYTNRQLAEQRLYISGKKEGLQQGWWPNDKQRFIYTAVDDAYNGELKEWDRKGMLFLDFNYTNGQEEGSEKLWWGNGAIRANYVVRNGKRYGLLGMKVCVNPYDSLFVNRESPPERFIRAGSVVKR